MWQRLEAGKRKASSTCLVHSVKCPVGLLASIIRRHTDLWNDLLKVTELKKESNSVANMKSCAKLGPTLWLCLGSVSEAGNTKTGGGTQVQSEPQG